MKILKFSKKHVILWCFLVSILLLLWGCKKSNNDNVKVQSSPTTGKTVHFNLKAQDVPGFPITQETNTQIRNVIKARLKNFPGVQKYSVQNSTSKKFQVSVTISKNTSDTKTLENFLTKGFLSLYLVRKDSGHILAKLEKDKNATLPPGCIHLKESFTKDGKKESQDVIVEVRPAMLVDCLEKARVIDNRFKSGDLFMVEITLTKAGGKRFYEMTKKYIHRRVAVVLDGKALMTPLIMQPITGNRFVISSSFNEESANYLVNLLKNGTLPRPLKFVKE